MMFRLQKIALVVALQHLLLGSSCLTTTVALQDFQTTVTQERQQVTPFVIAHSPTLPRMGSPKRATNVQLVGVGSNKSDEQVPNLDFGTDTKQQERDALAYDFDTNASWDRRELAKRTKKKRKNRRRKKPKFRSTKSPTKKTTKRPTPSPSGSPTTSFVPSETPSESPSMMPSLSPSEAPSESPSSMPSLSPSMIPSQSPSSRPSLSPSKSPSESPSSMPSLFPSESPSSEPSISPSEKPSSEPSISPSERPSSEPSISPSERPSYMPSLSPSHSSQPSFSPSQSPSSMPSCPLATEAEIKAIVSTVSTDTGTLIDTPDTAQKAGFEYVRDYPFDLDACSSIAAWHQRFALAVFYHSITSDPNMRLYDWVPTSPITDECSWSGVYCADDSTVSVVDFYEFYLEGAIPSEIAGLSSLTYLSFTRNDQLVKNNLEIVGELETLKSLYIQYNPGLTTIPNEIWGLSSLTDLGLAMNSLSSLPSELGNFVDLETLYVEGNSPSLLPPLPSFVCDLLDTADPAGKLSYLSCGNGPYYKDAGCCSTPIA